MPLKKLIENPILAVGILMMFIFLATYGPKLGLWEARSDKLRPTSCKAVIVKLKKRVPANWKVFCEGDTKENLAIEIQSSHLDIKDISKLRAVLYRQLANDLISTAKTSPQDNLEKTPYVRFLVIHPLMKLNALTQGQYLVKLSTLTDSKLIAEHLKVTVNIQETLK